MTYSEKIKIIEEEVDKMYSEYFKKIEKVEFKTETESNEYSINFYNKIH